MLISLSFISGTSCRNLQAPEHGFLSTDTALSGTVVIASCDEGYWFPYHTTEHVLFCNEDKHWNDSIEHCEGCIFTANAARNPLDVPGQKRPQSIIMANAQCSNSL